MNKKVQLLTFFLTIATFTLWGQARERQTAPQRAAIFARPQAELQLRATNDTLFYPAAADTCGNFVFTYTAGNTWGYLAGMNGYGDREKAQRLTFSGNAPFKVTQVWGYFSDAAVVGNGTLRAKIYTVNANTTGPGTLLGESALLNTMNVKTSATAVPVTIFTFPTPVSVTRKEFFASIDFSQLYTARDTVALFTTEAECGSGDDTWELFEDGTTWVKINNPTTSWGTNANFIMAAVVEFDAATDVNDPFVAQKGLRIFPASPNPTNNWVDLPYQLESSTAVNIEIYSADGKLLQRHHKIQQLPGRYAERIDVQSLPAGTYVYSVVTNEARVMSRFVVTH